MKPSDEVPVSTGGSILLLCGFGMPGATMRPLAATLEQRGMEAIVAPLGMNVDCGESTVARVIELIDRYGVEAIIGHSRGGQLGLVAAVRRPDQIRQLVTVGTPWSVGPPDRPGVAMLSRLLRFARAHGVDPMPSIDCGTGDCCAKFRDDIQRHPAATWTAFWSSNDRIAGTDSQPPEQADESVDLRDGHLS